MKRDLNPALIWNGWTRNYVPRNDGYIIHAWLEDKSQGQEYPRALCGVYVFDFGMLNLKDDEFEPSCFRCQAVLRKAGLMEKHDVNS